MTNCIDYKQNSINMLRLLAAFQVMWGHLIEHLEVEFPIIWGGISIDKSISWLFDFFNGVPIFFFISGFLIWLSIDRYNVSKVYYKNRFLRIYPELWIGVLVEIICIIVFVSPIIWKDLILFAGTQATIFQFWTPESLRQFGCGTPNGSLWTICVMIQFYIIAWPLKKICRNKKVYFWIIIGFIFIIIGAATKYIGGVIPEIFYKLYCQTIVQYFWIFWLGMIIAEYKEIIIPFLRKYWWISALCACVMRFVPFDFSARNFPILLTTFCLMALIGIAYKYPAINLKIDVSYGLFIYHMIVVNVFIELELMNNVTAFAGCILVSLALAYLSTVLIGKKVLKFKK